MNLMRNRIISALSECAEAHRGAKKYARLGRVFSRDSFEGAENQATRWHLYFDGREISSALCRVKDGTVEWFRGPEISAAELLQEEILLEKCREIAGGKTADLSKLGVVVHLGDQVVPGIVFENFEKPETHAETEAAVRDFPNSVIAGLGESAERSAQWRTYPLMGPERTIALKHELSLLEALEHLTEPEFDVKVAVHSAPIEALALLLLIYGAALGDKPHCFALYYDRFTLLAPFSGGVLDVKILPHRNQDIPENFGDEFFSLLEPLGLLSSCALVLAPCGSKDPNQLFEDLDSYANLQRKQVDGLEVQILHSESIWQAASKLSGEPFNEAIVRRPEFLAGEYPNWFGPEKEISFSVGIEPEIQRFGILSRVSFFPDDQAERDKRLPRSLAILLLSLKAARYLGVVFLLVLAGVLGFHLLSAYRGEAMQLAGNVISSEKGSYEELNTSLQYAKKWGRTLAPRSNAWSVMDFVLALLPESPEIACDSIHYSVRPLEARPTAKSPNKPGGFAREWVITGSCSEKGREQLARLQENAALTAIFNDVAQRLNQPIFAIENKRTVKAIARVELNSQQVNLVARQLPYKFSLTVTQEILGDDTLALPAIANAAKS
jgi:hypothetical protein